MEIINIDASNLADLLNERTFERLDYYRKIISINDDYVLGLYYKEFLDFDEINEESVEESIELKKNISDDLDEYPWENHKVARLFSKIDRINEAEKNIPRKFDKSVISGIVLCNNYPVGVIFPKKLLDYKSLLKIWNESIPLSDEEKNIIFDNVNVWVNKLIEQGVYPSLYLGNILVNPDDYSDIVLDGLDGPSVCRVENQKYVDYLFKNGFDLKERCLREYDKLRNDFCNYKEKMNDIDLDNDILPNIYFANKKRR